MICSVDSISVNSFSTKAMVNFSNWFIVGHIANIEPLPFNICLTLGITTQGSPRSIKATSMSVTGISLDVFKSKLCWVTYFETPDLRIFFSAIFIKFSSTSKV